MKLYASLIVLVAFAVLLPGGSLLLPLAYASYRKATGRIRVPASASGR